MRKGGKHVNTIILTIILILVIFNSVALRHILRWIYEDEDDLEDDNAVQGDSE